MIYQFKTKDKPSRTETTAKPDISTIKPNRTALLKHQIEPIIEPKAAHSVKTEDWTRQGLQTDSISTYGCEFKCAEPEYHRNAFLSRTYPTEARLRELEPEGAKRLESRNLNMAL